MAKMGIYLWSPGRISSPDLGCVPGAYQVSLVTCGSLVGLEGNTPNTRSCWESREAEADAQALRPVWRSSVAFHAPISVIHRPDPESLEHPV